MPTPEFPADQTFLSFVNTRRRVAESSFIDRAPLNEFDALLQCAPGEQPVESLGERQVIRELIAEAVDTLSEEHRYILDAINSERVSYQELAERLGVGKTQAWRLTQQALAAARNALIQLPTIRERIRMYDNWNDACRSAVLAIAPADGSLGDDQALAMIDRKIDALRSVIHSGNYAGADLIVPKMRTIGVAAAMMLDNRGAWSVDDMVDLLVRKQNDYGHGNINAFGLVGIVVRTSDKVARFHNLAGREGLAEPRVDALVDLVGYAVIATMLEDGSFQLPMAVSDSAGAA